MSTFRMKIERIGGEILSKYCQKTGPIFIPPIPASKFIDKVPEYTILQGQDGYQAEVKVFRYLEEVKCYVIVLHQVEYTHEQYAAFLPAHSCSKRKCDKEPGNHECHQHKTNVEGETDFVVLGSNFAMVLEVKGADAAVQVQSCIEDALRQRRRIVNLIKAIYPCLPVFEFTVFSNITADKIDEQFSSDESLLFSDELEHFQDILNSCETFATLIARPDDLMMEKLKRCLLGLWCINADGKWNVEDCSLSNCIKDLDDKLKRSLVTQKFVDEAEQKKCSKNKKGKNKAKKCPESQDYVEAPEIFKRYLNIDCLTAEQLKLFLNQERFIWVEGPAGTGKTIVMLGKIIKLALETPSDERILIILAGSKDTEATERLLGILNSIRDIECAVIDYDFRVWDGDISQKLVFAHNWLSNQLFHSSAKVVLLRFDTCLVNSEISVITRSFQHVFIDDCQLIFSVSAIHIDQERRFGDKNVVSQVLLPLMQNNATIKTIWVLNDDGQNLNDIVFRMEKFRCQYASLIEAVLEFKKCFAYNPKLRINLRNSFEISSVLSIIRKHHADMDFAGAATVSWPKQEVGHFLRGVKPVIRILKTSETSVWKRILSEELEMLKGLDSCLDNRDIAVLVSAPADDVYFLDTLLRNILSVTEKYNTTDNKIAIRISGDSVSAEWAGVVYICRQESSSTTVTLPDSSVETIRFSRPIPELYLAISRMRVFCSVILLNYHPNACQYTDRMLEELRSRRDICSILEQ